MPIETDSELSAVSITRYASEPCLIVKAVAELSLTATLISVPSALILSRAISLTLVMLLSPRDNAPAKAVIVVVPIVPPLTLSPLIWSLARVKVPPETSNVFPDPTVTSVPSIVPPSISNAEPSISTDPASSFLPRVIFSPEFEVTNFK